MKWLIWSIRTWFCKHKWERDEQWTHTVSTYGSIEERYIMVSATCEECGWHRKYKKFN
jgi:RNase P subunit RPR2